MLAILRLLTTFAADLFRSRRHLEVENPAFRPIQRIGNIASQAILGGLHHRYGRI
jgi:hypothetical protein